MGHEKYRVLKGILSAKSCTVVVSKMSLEYHILGTDLDSYYGASKKYLVIRTSEKKKVVLKER